MRSFIKKLAIFSVTIALMLLSLKILDVFTPWYWGNPTLNAKLDYLKKQGEYHDVYFIGSSRAFRSFVPKVFQAETNLSAFNLGIPGTKPPELYDLVTYMMDQKPDLSRPTYFLVEIEPFYMENPKKPNTIRRTYWLNWDNYILSVKHYLEEKKLFTVMRFTNNLVRHHTKFGIAREQYKYIRKEPNYRYLGERRDGYYSFAEQLASAKNHRLLERRDEFLCDTARLQKRGKKILAEYSNKSTYLNKHHLARMNELIDLAKQHNIRLIYVRQPLQTNLYALYAGLNESDRMDMAHPKKFPEFYTAANVYDRGHLMDEGSDLYTQKLAKLFLTKIKE